MNRAAIVIAVVIAVVSVFAVAAIAGHRARSSAAPAAVPPTVVAVPPGAAATGGLFGMPARASGRCRAHFARAAKAGPLCYRSCQRDGDCPAGALCRPFAGQQGIKLCVAQ